MSRAAETVWTLGRPTIGTIVRLAAKLKVYGRDRVPRQGGVVIACNHFSWLDPVVLGAASPRTIYYMAKIEAHRARGLGLLIRSFGCFPVRRGESDREAVRTMRKVVGEGLALGLFVEGSRQRSGVPGEIQAGAADGRPAGRRADRSGRRPRFADLEAVQLPSSLDRLR